MKEDNYPGKYSFRDCGHALASSVEILDCHTSEAKTKTKE